MTRYHIEGFIEIDRDEFVPEVRAKFEEVRPVQHGDGDRAGRSLTWPEYAQERMPEEVDDGVSIEESEEHDAIYEALALWPGVEIKEFATKRLDHVISDVTFIPGDGDEPDEDEDYCEASCSCGAKFTGTFIHVERILREHERVENKL